MADLLRVSIGGQMPGGEQWSVNPCFAFPAGGAVVTYNDALAFATAVSGVTTPTNLLTMNVPGVTFATFRVEARTKAGDLEAQAEVALSSPGNSTGSSGHPFQTSMVTSLRTINGTARGRGRLYWPATAVPLTSSSLRVSSGDVSAKLTAIKTYLSGVATALSGATDDPDVVLAVWSRSNEALYGVNQILAGDILDVQRRRRDRVKETYTSLTFP